MKPPRILLPAAALAAVVTLSLAQNEKKENNFDVPADRVEKIKAAMPAATQAPVKKKHEVLVFTKTAGFRHSSIPSGVECMKQLGAKTGLFNVTHTEDETIFMPESLAKFDAVIFLNSTGEIFKGSPAGEDVLKKSLVDFVQSGHGLVGMHSAGDTYNGWKDYGDMMGTGFISHPWGAGAIP